MYNRATYGLRFQASAHAKTIQTHAQRTPPSCAGDPQDVAEAEHHDARHRGPLFDDSGEHSERAELFSRERRDPPEDHELCRHGAVAWHETTPLDVR